MYCPFNAYDIYHWYFPLGSVTNILSTYDRADNAENVPLEKLKIKPINTTKPQAICVTLIQTERPLLIVHCKSVILKIGVAFFDLHVCAFL